MTAKRRACRTGKRQWRSAEQSKRAITSIKQSSDQRDRQPVRAYRCEHCGQFHLTSSAS